jgi:hypothetical protein
MAMERTGWKLMSVLLVLVLGLGSDAAVVLGQTATEGAGAQISPPKTPLGATEFAFGRGYDRAGKAPVDTGTVFPADVGQVFCYTRIVGAAEATEVVHAWYHEGETKAKVSLPVNSASWRTYSSKLILPAWTGRWEVKILDSDGAILASRSFTVQ